MVRTSHLRRLFALALLLALALAGLGVRLVVLQVFHHEKYRKIAEDNTQRLFLREPRRGDILDAQGNPLATSFPVKRLFANPRYLGHHYGEVARILAPVLRCDEVALAQRLKPIVHTDEKGLLVTNSYVNLKQKISLERWQQVTQAMLQLTFDLDETKLSRTERRSYQTLRRYAIYARDDQQRIYPSQNLASHILGFAQEQETEINNTSIHELAGRDGIEAWLDDKLRGVRGWRMTEIDGRKREIVVSREQEVEPRPGLNVLLTLDMVIQEIVESQLVEAVKKHSPVSASAIVVRPRTGEILAIATLPNFDPNNPGASPADFRRNRVISDIMEPGSTFKIVVVAAALHEQIVRLTDTFDCEQGRFYYQGKVLRDDHPHGVLNVENIITKSSNIGAAKIGIKLGEHRLYGYVRSFGFGDRTGLTLGGEVRGIVHPVKNWDRLTISRIPMGHAISVTPLQMIMAMCAIANEGRLMRPMLVSRLQEQNGEVVAQYSPQIVRQVIGEGAAQQMVAALKTVVSTNGTGSKAMLEHYTVGGKTGTAQKAGPGGYVPGKYIASFIGFFPADAPEVCISVVLDEPQKGYYGGQTAAPIFKNIAEQVAQYLKLRPDRGEAPSEGEEPTAPNRFNTVLAREP